MSLRLISICLLSLGLIALSSCSTASNVAGSTADFATGAVKRVGSGIGSAASRTGGAVSRTTRGARDAGSSAIDSTDAADPSLDEGPSIDSGGESLPVYTGADHATRGF